MRLKHLRIYALPDGKEYVADVFNGGGYGLVPYSIWNFQRLTAYRVDRDGRLLNESGRARWRVEHLRDTGREAQYPAPGPLA